MIMMYNDFYMYQKELSTSIINHNSFHCLDDYDNIIHIDLPHSSLKPSWDMIGYDPLCGALTCNKIQSKGRGV